MKTTFVLLVSLVLSGSAYAGGPSHNQYQGQAQQGQSQGQNTSVRDTNVNANQNINLTRSNSDSNSRSNSDSSSRSTANGGTSAVLGSENSDNHNAATGGQSSSAANGGVAAAYGGSSNANGGSATGGSAQGGSVGNTGAAAQSGVTNNNNYQQVRQAPSAYAPDALPSAPCRVSGSIGASSPVGGLSLGGSKLDTECDARETARAFALLGNKLAAARILCDTKAAKKAQLTYQECANYAVGYFGGVQDGDGPGFTVPAGKGTPKQ